MHEVPPAAPVAAPPEGAAPGPLLVPGVNDGLWPSLFAGLATQGAISAPFTERRIFAFRRTPVALRGEMRFDPKRGLSLHYLPPDEAWMIADDRGLLLRDGRGRTREVPNDPRGASAGAALLPVLRFDFAALIRTFAIRAAGNIRAWRLDFTPKDPALARTFGSIILSGTGTDLRRIEFRRSATQRVEILVGPAQTGLSWSAADAARYFR